MNLLHSVEEAANKTYTENGAVTLATTGSCCLDLFATVGALRHVSEEEICLRFMRAYAEDRDIAMKILFFARDVRGGLGERRAFRVITHWLAGYAKQSVIKNLSNVPEYGRYDDLLSLLGTACEAETMSFIAAQWKKDMQALKGGAAVSLLGKWLPSANATNAETVAKAKKVAKALGLRPADYRKALSALRKQIHILENDLRVKDYRFDYAAVPSKAMYKYRRAFMRNDAKRYSDFLNNVEKGIASMHTDVLTPYDVIAPIISKLDSWPYDESKGFSEKERRAMNVTWNSLPDYTCGENALVVVDGSGSMYGYSHPMPAAVAQSLGIYFAERNKGQFKDSFITFSEHPQLVRIKGEDIVDKVAFCKSFDECANTDIEAVFRLILSAARNNHVPQAEMPSRIYIISDMEFDQCAENAELTNFQKMERLYKLAGYSMPEVVFWNVDSRNRQQPVKKNQQGVALVSGCTPRLFEMLATGNLSPYACMMDVLNRERYRNIVA
jgi:hypothetical protein